MEHLKRRVPIFGLSLRVYEKEGDFYGRQYPIDGGRLDILAIDDANNFYVIELKKDGGYDDAYCQTKRYIQWIKKNKATDAQKVVGIICLNSPTAKIIKQVQRDDEIRLIGYAISYTEIS
ncbi:endonuclease NucS [Ruminococcaceae bacterium OttesenSCG-928-L11]|nr:endonuclease NucS [Ruminococcaceae bacterium OttesenSCG-928-L11]